MIKSELIYNPYLLETEVRFNGNPPRINSLVEKYQDKKLQSWVSLIPSIFYDEMNGYNFELDFSGPELDFEEVRDSFVKAGVGKDLVQLFHKGELKSRNEKSLAIDSLLEWLQKNPNRKFDFPSFMNENKELFEGAYPLVVIGGSIKVSELFNDIEISVDNVESADELRKTDLQSTPVIFYLDRKSVGWLQYNLVTLLKRNDITAEQLFFIISPVLGEKVKRVIQDLGVKEPQIILSPDDNDVYKYLEIFPVSEYIYDAIKAFRKQTDQIEVILDEENKKSEITNKDIHGRIKELEAILGRLKAACERLKNKDNIDLPSELKIAKLDLLTAINQWKKKKTKISKPEEARLLSYEFDTEVRQRFEQFKMEIQKDYSLECASLLSQCEECYREVGYREDFVIEKIEPDALTRSIAPNISDQLMEIKEEQYVMPKEDFLGKFFKSNQEEVPREPVLETTYYYEKWRSYAVGQIEPVADQMIQEAYSFLQAYYQKVSLLYVDQIEKLIEEITEEKEKVSSQLSADEQLLQADNDWYAAFCEKIHDIERS